MIDQLNSYYRFAEWSVRLHVAIRLATCPFGKLEELIPTDGTILDYGCGHGVFSLYQKLVHAERHVIGCDVAENKIVCANKAVHAVEGIRFVCDESYVDDAPFDAIVLSDVLYFVRNQKELIAKLVALLKPSGKLILKDIAREMSLRFVWTYAQDFLAKNILRITNAEGLYYMSTEAVKKMLEENDLLNVCRYDLSQGLMYPHYALVGEKRNAKKKSSAP